MVRLLNYVIFTVNIHIKLNILQEDFAFALQAIKQHWFFSDKSVIIVSFC